METQKIQIINNIPFKKSTTKHTNVIRILFLKEYTKIDFGFNSRKINYTKGKRLKINNSIYIRTTKSTYKLIDAQIQPFFYLNKNSDIQYFSLVFESIDENIDSFDIIDNYKDKDLLPFGFEQIDLSI